MLDFQAFIERNFIAWTWRQLLAALVAVALAVGGASAAFPTSAPALKETADGDWVPQIPWLTRDDPRAFANIGDLPDGRFDVAWISASAIRVTSAPDDLRFRGNDRYDMTDILARKLVLMNNEPVRVEEYLMEGARSGDMRRAILQASHQASIDAYIVELNPMWLLNDLLAYSTTRQRARIITLPDRRSRDLLAAALSLRPSEIGLELLSIPLSFVRDRHDYIGWVPAEVGPGFPFINVAPGMSETQRASFWQSALKPIAQQDAIPHADAHFASMRDAILAANLSPESFGMRALAANVADLAQTGKPVLLFMPPLNPAIRRDKVAMDALSALTEAVRTVVESVGVSNIRLSVDSVWSGDDPEAYVDYYHRRLAPPVVNLVIAELEAAIGSPFAKLPDERVYGERFRAIPQTDKLTFADTYMSLLGRPDFPPAGAGAGE